MRTFLACDIGASGGRHIAGQLADGRLRLTEISRFENGATEKDSRLTWDADALERAVTGGIRRAADMGLSPDSVGVDTWGVDYVLLDEGGERLGDCACYRDNRTAGMADKLAQSLPFARHYALTGVARQPFNTVYQLMSEPPDRLRAASRLLMLPDYLHYRLTGRICSEYTIATTTGLLNAVTRQWDARVLSAAGIPARLFQPVAMPGTVLGDLRADILPGRALPCQVTLPPSHDTASAYLAVPARDEGAVYLSSGTWSLIGVESASPILRDDPAARAFTNEGCYGGGVRYLKNIMGLWILQRIRREQDGRYTYAEMARLALDNAAYAGRFDANDPRLLLPEGMTATVQSLLAENGSPAPRTDGQLFAAVLRSLADCYAAAIGQLSAFTGRRFSAIHIVGGGSNNDTLNQWTADAAGLPVYAGPGEGTALGNILSQMLALGEVASVPQARELVRDSFDIRRFAPQA